MSVLTRVEAKSRMGIALQVGVTLALIGGGLTMVYPFLLMLSGSVRSEMDVAEMDIVPDYLSDDTILVRKFLEAKYCHDVSVMNRMRGYQDFSFVLATVPKSVVTARADDLQRFMAEEEVPLHWQMLGGTKLLKRISSASLRRLRTRIYDRLDGDLAALGENIGSPLNAWSQLTAGIPEWSLARFDYTPSILFEEYEALLRERPLADRALESVTGTFLQNMVGPVYGTESTAPYNQAHARPIADFASFALPGRLPGSDQPVLREEWTTFVREVLNVSFIRADAADADYRGFLRAKYGTATRLNERWQTDHASIEAVRLPGEREWVVSSQRQDYKAFLESLPAASLYLVGPEFAWRHWLSRTYAGDLRELNDRYHRSYTGWAEIPVPLVDVEVQYVLANTGALRWEFATTNFVNVLYEIVVQGRAFLNTVIFVALALVLTLTLQPLAAYALSRFRPPGMWKLILLFMATMAFPPMVGMIPQFLILRELGLLNTFIALVLPIVVNGYLIFLLKGFFDSLPQHLYEAAIIDGASELRMFWELTMSLSKPILAVVALQTFQLAWLMFLYPLLVCPDDSMHVLAVWLSQFQQEAPSAAVFASILIVSIPTMLVFLVTQRTIMRGIAVPSEK